MGNIYIQVFASSTALGPVHSIVQPIIWYCRWSSMFHK